jgi:hypothetical protein
VEHSDEKSLRAAAIRDSKRRLYALEVQICQERERSVVSFANLHLRNVDSKLELQPLVQLLIVLRAKLRELLFELLLSFEKLLQLLVCHLP